MVSHRSIETSTSEPVALKSAVVHLISPGVSSGKVEATVKERRLGRYCCICNGTDMLSGSRNGGVYQHFTGSEENICVRTTAIITIEVAEEGG